MAPAAVVAAAAAAAASEGEPAFLLASARMIFAVASAETAATASEMSTVLAMLRESAMAWQGTPLRLLQQKLSEHLTEFSVIGRVNSYR